MQFTVTFILDAHDEICYILDKFILGVQGKSYRRCGCRRSRVVTVERWCCSVLVEVSLTSGCLSC